MYQCLKLFAAITESVFLCVHFKLGSAFTACALKSNHFRYDRRTQQLPLTWVRVPPGALVSERDEFKYACDTSRFSVNRYQPVLFLLPRI